jgi:hypothetical protein
MYADTPHVVYPHYSEIADWTPKEIDKYCRNRSRLFAHKYVWPERRRLKYYKEYKEKLIVFKGQYGND